MKMMVVLCAVLWSVGSCVCAEPGVDQVFTEPNSQRVLVQLWEDYGYCRSVYWNVNGLRDMDDCSTIWKRLQEAFVLGLAGDDRSRTKGFSDKNVDKIFERLAVCLERKECIEYSQMTEGQQLTRDQEAELRLPHGELRRWRVEISGSDIAERGTLRIYIPRLLWRLEGSRVTETEC